MEQLVVRGLRKTYEADSAPVRALRGVDLTVSSGEFVALMGPSGCGKSTLLHLVAGLDRPDEGTVSLAGARVDALSARRLALLRRRHVAPVGAGERRTGGVGRRRPACRRAAPGAEMSQVDLLTTRGARPRVVSVWGDTIRDEEAP
jgi:energy-coupling factor transporter ATP-binding protein EcfA2